MLYNFTWFVYITPCIFLKPLTGTFSVYGNWFSFKSEYFLVWGSKKSCSLKRALFRWPWVENKNTVIGPVCRSSNSSRFRPDVARKQWIQVSVVKAKICGFVCLFSGNKYGLRNKHRNGRSRYFWPASSGWPGLTSPAACPRLTVSLAITFFSDICGFVFDCIFALAA